MDLGLGGRRALVTGGGKGIGAAVARELAAMGAEVVINFRADRDSAEAVAAEIPGSRLQQADVGDPAQVAELFASSGPFDVVVNNAGILRDRLLLRMSTEDWDQVLRTDLSAAFHVTKAAVPQMMRSRWGRIVNVTSIVGLGGNPGQANYAAAKAGLVQFTRTVAVEVARRGVTVNAVAPGFIATDMTSELIGPDLLAAIPARRAGNVEEVAACVRFLVSRQASYVTGAVLTVDGGLGA